MSLMSNSKTVVIVLVNYKRPVDTLECISSLLKLNYTNWSCVICENGSGDGSYEVIKKGLESLPDSIPYADPVLEGERFDSFGVTAGACKNIINLVSSTLNRGFAGGNNYALNMVSKLNGLVADYYWFLNNDTVVDENSLTELVSFMGSEKGSSVGICGSTILYYGNRNVIQCKGGARYLPLFGIVKEVGNLDIYPFNADGDIYRERLDYVSGASMFASRRFLSKVGLMSEDYFLYFEELDWACRARKFGFQLGYVPNSIVWHKEGLVLGSGASTKRSKIAEFYGLRSRLKFTLNHYPLFIPVVWFVGVLQLFKRLFRFQFDNSKSLVRALAFRSDFHS